MSSLNTIVFDFDGTMVDSLDVIVDDINAVVKGFGGRPVKEKWVERTMSGGTNSIMNSFGIFRRLTDKLVWLVEQEQARHIDELDPVPGLRKVLTELNHRGYRLGIVSSNIEDNIEAYLMARKMKELFSFVYADGKVSHKGKLMQQMMKEQQLTAEAVIYVGDEPRDVLAAREVGVKTVGVTWGFQPKKAFTEVHPEWLISKPNELLEICPPRSWWQRLFHV